MALGSFFWLFYSWSDKGERVHEKVVQVVKIPGHMVPLFTIHYNSAIRVSWHSEMGDQTSNKERLVPWECCCSDMRLNFSLQSDIFGSLNDQGLLSRASEALVAMDMKHPVSSAHQVFPPIKSDMMYSHPAITSAAAAAASGTSISRSSNQVSSCFCLQKSIRPVCSDAASLRNVYVRLVPLGNLHITQMLFLTVIFFGSESP